MSKYHNELKSIIHNIDFSNFWLMHFFLKGVKYKAKQKKYFVRNKNMHWGMLMFSMTG